MVVFFKIHTKFVLVIVLLDSTQHPFTAQTTTVDVRAERTG
jgi:Zn-dependent M32 family carboxypeptidase